MHDRTLIGGRFEVDIYIPSRKVGIEYNGIRWHSELFGKDRFYHLNKSERCREMGIRLIQIFEDDYNRHKDAVLSKILHILGLDYQLQGIPGRKCTVREIVKPVAKWFLDRNNVEGYTNCTKRIGCYYKSMLIGVMCLTRIRNDSDEWMLTRFATESGFRCQGVCGKMFKWFIRKYSPTMVKALADRGYTYDALDNVYTRMGFKLDKEIDPDYKYVLDENPTDRIEKFELLKKKIRTDNGIPLDATETDVAKALGLSKVWDCGKARYKWLKKEKSG